MASTQTSWPSPMRAIGAQNLLTMPGGVSHSGYLHKKGGSQFSLMKWPLRFIILHKGCVYYFKSSTSSTPQGAFSLNGYNRVMRATEETTSSNVFPFKIVHFSKRHRTWYFSASCEDERKKWMLDLRKEIDYYHDRNDSRCLSDPDVDTDFYGSVERPLEISYVPDNQDNDYVEEDEEDEDDDYLEPDASQNTNTGRPPVPPPSYPPPPVPYQPRLEPLLHVSSIPPAPTRGLPASVQKSSPPPPPPKPLKPDQPSPRDNVTKGPPPPVPFAPHLLKYSPEPQPQPPRSPILRSQTPEHALKMQLLGSSTCPPRTVKPLLSTQSPATLPICTDLETKLSLVLSGRSLASLSPTSSPRVDRQQEEQPRPAMYKPPLVPKLQPKESKPKPKGPFQRSSPDGQSFRSSVNEVSPHLRKAVPNQNCNSDNDEDDDYENVQLPDSVFVDTTETSNVEKLFKETEKSPQDGLYCIRNSGTKTSKVLVVWDVGLNKARNYRLFEEDARIYLESNLTFASLAALVEYYYLHPLPNHNSLCLQKPYGYTPPR